MSMFKTLKRIHTDSAKYQAAFNSTQKTDVLAFSVADSDYETAPKIKQALNDRIKHGAFGYGIFDEDTKILIKDWYEHRYQSHIKTSWIMPAPKVLNTLSVMLQTLTKRGDKILIQPPVYHVFEPLIDINERTLTKNPLRYHKGHYDIDFDHLETQFKTGIKAFIFCSPHNPVGRVWPKETIEKIVSLCKQYGVYLLSDEIHADIIMPNHTFISCADYFDNYENIIVINAPSKTFNIAGLQIAYFITPNEDVREKLTQTYQALMLGTPNLLAVTALKAAYKACDNWVDEQNAHVYKNFRTLKDFFAENFSKAHVLPLEGTYLAWIDLGFLNLSSVEITKALENNGMVVADGHKFGSKPDHFIRMNIACSNEQLLKGLKRFKDTFSGEQNEDT